MKKVLLIIAVLLLSVVGGADPQAQPILTTDAGSDKTVVQAVPGLPTPVTLLGTVREFGALAPPGVIVNWSHISGPGTFTVNENRAVTTGYLDLGTHTLRLTATDPPPQINITSPQPGIKSNTSVIIAATATDNVGVVKIELYIDNEFLASTLNSSIIGSWNLRPKRFAIGPHEVKAMAYDTVGLRGWQTITVEKIK